KSPFAECGATQERSAGWVPARGEPHGPLAASVVNQWVMRFMTEAKMLPASVLNRRVNEKAAHIEATEGRKPGKKEKKDLKEDITHELLPMAFTRTARVTVWVDQAERRLVVNSSNAARAD
ncbi:recombination-associated protein RdgC, partial [Glaesserella parasuis]|uniref:recombination-associated protein RdgC n=1 Tax=Glaesserella parasuis TaxID=738 RepID=UPI003B7B0A94